MHDINHIIDTPDEWEDRPAAMFHHIREVPVLTNYLGPIFLLLVIACAAAFWTGRIVEANTMIATKQNPTFAWCAANYQRMEGKK